MAFTESQQKVIDQRNKNLIVSAAAGSGKTTVMIERIKQLISKEHVPISNFLIVTFTKASASDMKAKLVNSLSEMQPDSFILDQIDDVSTADVSNLHSFCARLLKTYFYVAGLDPTFVVLSDDEAETLKQKALDKLFEEKFDSNDKSFYVLFDVLQQNRSDRSIRENILKLNEFFNVIFDKQKWFENCIKSLYNDNFMQNRAANIINGYVCGRVKKLREEVENRIKQYNELQIKEFVAYLQDVESALMSISDKNNFEKNAKILFSMSNFAVPPKIEEAFDEYRKNLDDFRKYLNKELENFKNNYISDDIDKLKRELGVAKTFAQTMFDATLRFQEIYGALKQEKCGLDYNDLEHYALLVLENDEIRETLKEKYKYVFVDEYQDINAVQEKIISLLSGDNNRFMVGDVKQSIYGFRLCDPDIFLQKYHEYKEKNNSEAVNLSKNFRSNANILAFVNMIFEGRMTEEFGGVDYAKDAALDAGTDFNQIDPVTLCYIDTTELTRSKSEIGRVEEGNVYSVKNHKQQDELENLKSRAEAEYIATEIEDLIANKTIYDSKLEANRPIKFKDISILISARNDFLQTLVEVLSSHGIPSSTDATIDILKDEYVHCIYNYLKLIYNSKQDIELFSVLYSPISEFSLNELSEMRICNKNCEYFYKSLENTDIIAQKNAKLAQKIQEFNQKLTKYREIAGYKTIKELAKQIIFDHNLESLALSEIDGEQKCANIKTFVENLPQTNLFDYFASVPLEKMAAPQTANESAVQIVTIHKSKGLEYPVVFLANISRTFNMQSLNSNMLISKDLGLGINFYDQVNRTKNKSLAKEAIKLTEHRKMVEEEQRLLYVALTRAINKLYVVGARDFDKLKRNFPERQSSFADWFDEFVFRYLELGEAFNFNIVTKDASLLLDTEDTASVPQIVFGGKKNDYSSLMERSIGFEYPNAKDTLAPQKTSVTEIASGFHESEEVFKRYNVSHSSSSAEKGNAYHKLMQHIDFSVRTLPELENNLKQLLNSGKITNEELTFVNKNAIIKLLNNPKFLSLLSDGIVLREKEFFMNTSQGKNVQIVQGVIDLAIIGTEKSHIIDYKTGNFSSRENLIKYSKQLELYVSAAKKAFEKENIDSYIVAVETGDVYKIKE